ncbi:hypothetical protein CWB99_06655 [Pseudoalteromonas rubra]|uniref:Uncharacterized protein n=1 Tax=Pseudoalteromonas rubra TaxID=43658 RepID=A0A5S3WQI5_9GAMM|nr:hypothetical protein CWB99_06655 [Pseudoalteromonas rubra]TMP35440.1 hypothetical protein CWC00_04715 [Pseudoalteromonas rubra]
MITGDDLKSMRLLAGKTQQHMAELVDISRKWLTKFNVNKVHEVHLTHAEGIIAGIYRVITIVMWLALAENILRNLAQLGVDKEIADMFYNWTFIYYNYELFIYPLRAIICGLVLSLLIVSSIDTERLEKNQTS